MASSDSQKILDKLQKANGVMENLIDLALSDEKISEDEQFILFSINDNLQLYVQKTIETIKDNVVSNKDKDELKELQLKIISDAEKVAMKDSAITADEKTLLDNLIVSIKALSLD